MKLKRIKINRFRNVASGSELQFHDGINVLLGKNASGKTTLLKLLTMIGSGSFPGLEQEDFDLEGELQSEKGTLKITAKNQQIDEKTSASTSQLTLQLAFTPEGAAEQIIAIAIDGAYATLSADGSELSTGRLKETPFNEQFLRPSFLRSALDTIWFAQAQAKVPREALARALDSVQGAYFSASLWSRYDEALTFQDQLLKEMSLRGFMDRGQLHSLSGPGFRQDHLNTYFAEWPRLETPPDQLTIESADYPPLRTAVERLAFKSATLHLDLESQRELRNNTRPSEKTESYEVFYKNPRIYLTRSDGTRLKLEQLSFGQQRLFCYFYYLGLHPDVVVADELANGMHHSMIAECLDALGPRQAFLATQNPLLLDHLGFTDAEDVRRTFVLCESRVIDGREQLSWTQLSGDEATEFFRDYQVGFQHNNDILRTRGLW